MEFLDDAQYCAMVVHASQKYNRYGMDFTQEYNYISLLEDNIKKQRVKEITDEIVLTNRICFFHQMLIKLCRHEIGTDTNIELLKLVYKVYNTLGEIIVRCHNQEEERYDYIDELAYQKKQVEFVLNNSKEYNKVFYSLMLAEIKYVIDKYCAQEFIEV